MNRVIIFTGFLLAFAITACQKETTSPITSFTASQGNCYGIVRLAVEQVSNVENYSYERKNPQTNQWEDIYWGYEYVFDDTGWGLPGNQLLPGQVYEYRVRAHTDKGSYGDFSPIAGGYMFSPDPRVTKMNYEIIDEQPGSYNLEYRIADKLPVDIQNLRYRTFLIHRAESYDMTLNNMVILNLGFQSDNTDSVFAGKLSIYDYDNNKTYYYKIEATYEYWFNGIRQNDYLEYTEGWYEYNSKVYEGASINGGDPNGQIGEITYTINNFNEIAGSVSGAKDHVMLRADGSHMYLGYLANYMVTGMGTPAIHKFNGTSWENQMDMPETVTATNGIDEFDFTVKNDMVYLAARTMDSLFVFRHDGSWSQNLSTETLRGDGYHKYLTIEWYDNDIYASVLHDDDIKLFKLEGDEWTQVGEVIASGFHTNTKLRNIDGTLYICYEEHVSGSSETTLHIKHLEGTSWVSDLEWSKDNATGFEIVKAGSTLYFIDGYGKGGVYKVESNGNASSLFDDAGSLYGSPESITVDASGNIVISCLAIAQNPEDMNLAVLIYDGSSWKKINDDFSETSFQGKTSAVQSINDNVHFVYGLKSSENDWNRPTILKAKRYVK